MFNGSLVALVTPFQDGKVDYRTLDEPERTQRTYGVAGHHLHPAGHPKPGPAEQPQRETVWFRKRLNSVTSIILQRKKCH